MPMHTHCPKCTSTGALNHPHESRELLPKDPCGAKTPVAMEDRNGSGRIASN